MTDRFSEQAKSLRRLFTSFSINTDSLLDVKLNKSKVRFIYSNLIKTKNEPIIAKHD